jgi:hypothetical protein
MRKLLQYLVLIILPSVFIVVGLCFHRAQYSTDPEYAYLMNGLNIAHLKSVGHFDHPGSTIQMWNAAMLQIIHLLDTSTKLSLENAVIQDADKYIGILISSTILLNGFLLFILGFVVFKRLGSLWYVLILQLTPFLSSNILEQAWTKLSPEPFLMTSVSLFLMVLIYYFTSRNRENIRYSILFALVIAFGIATKVTFLPLVIIPLIIIEKFWNKIFFGLACIPAFVLFTLPALPAYRLMIKWFIGLGTHTGTYGQGDKGLIDPIAFKHNILAICQNNVSLSITILISGLLLFGSWIVSKARNKPLHGNLMKFIFALLLTQVFGIVLVAKHYHMNHYLIPVLCLSGITWVFILMLLKQSLTLKPWLINGSSLLITTGMLILVFLNIPYLSLADHYYKLTNDEYISTQKTLEKDYKEFTLVDYYPYSINPINGLRWGNVYSRKIHTESLKTMYSDRLFYDTFLGSFSNWDKPISASELLEKFGPRLLIVGGHINKDELLRMKENKLELIPIIEGRTQAIYMIDTTSGVFKKDTWQKPLNSVCFTMDSISSNNKYYIAGSEKIDQDNKRNNEDAHSGLFSVKLKGADLYSLSYKLINVEPGQEYHIGIWRKGDNTNTFLVAAGEKSEQFYIQASDYTEGNAKGWNHISFNFTVPQTLSTHLIKIYVWNNSGKDVFFDDLTISRLK